MNSITLLGALTKNPELVGGEESPVCRLRLLEANGHPEHPLYINVSVFGAQAKACAQHLAKGRRVAVVGKLRFREWQRVDRSRRSEHWVAADRVDFLPVSAPVSPEPVGDPCSAGTSSGASALQVDAPDAPSSAD